MIAGLVQVDEDFGMAESAAAAVARDDAVLAGDRRDLRDQIDSVPTTSTGFLGEDNKKIPIR